MILECSCSEWLLLVICCLVFSRLEAKSWWVLETLLRLSPASARFPRFAHKQNRPPCTPPPTFYVVLRGKQPNSDRLMASQEGCSEVIQQGLVLLPVKMTLKFLFKKSHEISQWGGESCTGRFQSEKKRGLCVCLFVAKTVEVWASHLKRYNDQPLSSTCLKCLCTHMGYVQNRGNSDICSLQNRYQALQDGCSHVWIA